MRQDTHMERYKIYSISLLTAASLAASTYFGGGAGCSGKLDPITSGPGAAPVTVSDTVSEAGSATDSGSDAATVSPDITAPTVSSTNPSNAAIDVASNQKIVASFSEEMDPLTIVASNIEVTGPGAASIAGSVDYVSAGNTVTMTPDSNLTASTLYTVTITTGAKDLAGNALASNFVWSFTTGATPDLTAPTVVATLPASDEVGVALNVAVKVTFSEAMNTTLMTAGSYTLAAADLVPISGTFDYDLINNIATFTPGSNLAPSTTYTGTITTGMQDLAGNALASHFVWSFTTGLAPDVARPTVTATNPTNADMSVALNKTVAATFSEAMNTSTIAVNSYTLTTADLTPVLGAVNYDSVTHIATFNPDSDLSPSTTYTATLTTAVQDLAGNALLVNMVWSFTTGIEAAQTVIQEPVQLGVSSSFAILASAAITNIATSIITGDVGLTPDSGSNITGFSVPEVCPEVTGEMYAVDAAGPACALIDPVLLSNAKAAALVAFEDARASARGTPQSISGNLNGLTLYPGLYESGSSLEISPGGFLYLDAQGDVNAVFVIRSATSITTQASSEVVLTKGAKASNVYWTAGSTVTLGTNSIMKGSMIAGTSLSLLTGANLEGRALNQGPAAEAITLDSATITVPSP